MRLYAEEVYQTYAKLKKQSVPFRFTKFSGRTGDFALEGSNGAVDYIGVVGVYQQLLHINAPRFGNLLVGVFVLA